MRTPLSVAGAVLGALSLSAGLASPVAADTPVDSPTAAAEAFPDPAGFATVWLANQLVEGTRLQVDAGEFGVFDDPGLTADAVLAFGAVGAVDIAPQSATGYLTSPETVTSYIGDGVEEAYAGATAKLAFVVQVRGLPPTDVAGVDLLARLDELQAESRRFSDRSEFGDFSNVIGQSLAVVILERAGTPSPEAADVLLASQCADGGFDLTLEPVVGECESSVDPTGFAIEALLASGRSAVDPDVAAALDYLEAVQGASGGFGGDAEAGTGENANSTGLAALALRTGGRDEAADAAVTFILGLQVGCTAPVNQRGAIALDATGFERQTATRATPQALLGLAGQPLATLSGSRSESGFQVDPCDPIVAACAGVTALDFPDVDDFNVHRPAIGCLAGASSPTIAGYPDGTFRPAVTLNRGQAATLVARVLTASGVTLPEGGPTFPDVAPANVHAEAISALAELGIVAGFTDGRFGPDEPVNRGSLASLVARAWPVLTGEALAAGPDAFTDDGGSVHEPALNATAAYGLVLGRGDSTVGLVEPARRDEAASVVARLLGAYRIAAA